MTVGVGRLVVSILRSIATLLIEKVTDLGKEFGSPGRGYFVVVGGPDGVGKTTLAAALSEAWPGPTRYFHFIPSPNRPLSAEAPNLEAVAPPKNRARSSWFLGIVRLARNWIRGWIAYMGPIRRAVRSEKLVVGDRWLYGYIVQPRAMKFEGPDWLARVSIRTSPRPDLLVVLDAPSAVVHGRKQDLSLEEIEAERNIWRGIPGRPYLVDSRRPASELAAEIIQTIGLRANFAQYPPLSGPVLVPRHPRAATVAATALYAPCRPTVIAAHRAMRALIRITSGSWLTPTELWERGVPAQLWLDLLAALARDGLRTEAMAVHKRNLRRGPGFSAVTLEGGEITAFVRVAGHEDIQSESAILELVRKGDPAAFLYPVVTGMGSIGDLSYLTTTSVLNGFHRPPRRPPLGEIVSEIQAVLEPLPRGPDVRPDWVPIHGDLTPWNLRESKLGLSLIDWEDARWAPSGADELLYAETARLVRQPALATRFSREAAEYLVRSSGTHIKVRANLEQRLEMPDATS